MRHEFDPNDILHLPLIANLATTCEDGPRNAPVWFIWEERMLWMLGDARGSSVKRLHKDPRCAVEVVHYQNETGVLLHLGFRGHASIEPCCPDRFGRLLEKYLGNDRTQWNDWFIQTIARIDDPQGRMIRLRPESTFTNNVSYFRTGPDLAWPLVGQSRMKPVI